MLARLIAVVVHEIVTEYRKLDAQGKPEPQREAPPAYDPASTTSVITERATSWDHDTSPPVSAFGFGPPKT